MTSHPSVAAEDGAVPVGSQLVPDPFLHREAGHVYNPLTGRALAAGEPGFHELAAWLDGSRRREDPSDAVTRRLVAEGWLIAPQDDAARRFRLEWVSLETHSACNQKCFFCPVSIDPRPDALMPTSLFERIVDELTAYRSTLRGLFLMSYNEPTADARFVAQCRTVIAARLPLAVNTNGTGLTPARVDALLEAGPFEFLSVNLSTLDRERYQRERGEDHVALVLRNLDDVGRRPIARRMVIVVLGAGDEAHRADHEAIRARFAGSPFEVQFHRVMDRAGYVPVGLRPERPHRRLAGCENMGSRPLQHLHVTATGVCVLCCEDYGERHVVGDLRESRVDEVLRGDAIARLRRFVYGLEEAPEDFLCRKCVFARTR
jgi:MoaA/NifB/PqqE/SkfB family radical SAM enzyme